MSTATASVGQRIKTARRQRGISQAELAHPELSDSYVSLIESGKRTATPAVLELLAEKLECSLSYLLSGVTAEQQEELEHNLRHARQALDSGSAAEARTRYAALLADDTLASFPHMRQAAELGLADALQSCGDLDEAVVLLTRVRQRDAAQMPVELYASITCALAGCQRRRGDLTAAVQVAEQLLAGVRRPVWSEELIRLGAELLIAYAERGDLLRGRQFRGELLAAADRLGTAAALTVAHQAAAVLAVETGRGDEALAHVERAIAAQAELGDADRLERLHGAYARIALGVQPAEAEKWYRRLAGAHAELTARSATAAEAADCTANLIRAELLLGSAEGAKEHLTALLEQIEGLPRNLQADVHLLAGQAMADLGRRREAVHELAAVAAWLEEAPATRPTARAWLTVAQTLQALGEPAHSVAAYQRALACIGL
ncbi:MULTISPECIES: helix-turn-helix domain-containing protein [Streptosporangium]|uniref:Transcriptional regulator with XRE-family HTH domain n=1 Tax=Streptosporangium brasiliense TaxID=47480 RepID=A0ABT9REA5_9ACTN|nr:helix-turn-helix domain-containing protein [Streptosporangium brasiliense]MDP9867601.1 transcriptional regulator with XRE-family HTH domain [Streptosporangium brasiliense]